MRNRPSKKASLRPSFRASIKALSASALGIGAAIGFIHTASAQNLFTPQTGDYNNPANWSLGHVPTGTDNAEVVNGGTITVDDNEVSNDFNVGGFENATNSGDGTVNMTAGTFNAGSNGGWMRIGFSNNGGTPAGVTGTFNLSGGTLNETAGGAQINLGEYSGATGNFNISGTGAFNVTGGGATINIGDAGERRVISASRTPARSP